MDIRIGVIYTPKEVGVELADDADLESLRSEIESALTGASPVLWLEDKKGRRVAVPSDKISYVEFGGDESRPIGFG